MKTTENKSTIQESKLITYLKNPDRFKLLEDGWIQDSFTGLDFGPSSEKSMDYKDAVKYCKDNGGRLPEAHELHSLVNFSKNRPASYPIFKDMKFDNWYWTGTKTSWNKDASLCVSFYNGGVYDCFEYNGNYVRPCRASQ